jgi:hypothetical protein
VIPCWSIYIKEQPGSLKLQTVSSWIWGRRVWLRVKGSRVRFLRFVAVNFVLRRFAWDLCRVARLFTLKPKFPIWVNFGGPWI